MQLELSRPSAPFLKKYLLFSFVSRLVEAISLRQGISLRQEGTLWPAVPGCVCVGMFVHAGKAPKAFGTQVHHG